MAGHSQFKNIMHRKGRQDAQKSKLFGKLAREITVAAKMGQPDPAMNARLRAAIISARQENMSKDSIERAVKKASGGEGENYDEIRYEGYGPGGVAVIVEALTDNRNRAASDIRSFFAKSGGNLGETGSVAFLMARSMLSFGMFSWRAAMTAARSRGFMTGSGVPSLAATVISRASLPNSFDFWASCLPLRCMMFLNWEWPAMQGVSGVRPGRMWGESAAL